MGQGRIAFIGLGALCGLIALTSTAEAAEIRIPIPAWLLLLPAIPLLWGVKAGASWAIKRANAADIYNVWYATNREQTSDGYGNDITDDLRLGICQVAIPKSHKFGSIGSSKLKRLWQRLRTGADDQLLIRGGMEIPESIFSATMQDALTKNGDDILVYIHGYNVSFGLAIIRAAQIGFDLKIQGVTAAFCWASRGKLDAYNVDEDTVRLSERHLAMFFLFLKENFPNKKINVLAHSMGNRALLGVLEKMQFNENLQSVKFGQIFLAAPDVDARYFKGVSHLYSTSSVRTTLYICPRDKALQISAAIHDDPRTGYSPPVTIAKGIDTVEAADVYLDMIGHGYYAEAASVLYDMAILLRNNAPPSKRPCLYEVESPDGNKYWTFRRVNA